ncbi:MAG: mechanosensitive ion channel [Moraxella sp.]|nr:mechanosensitive ion channel [Moraxella sp.]
MNHAFMVLNQYFTGPIGSIIGAILIFFLGYFAALIFGSLTKTALTKLSLNQKMSNHTGKSYDIATLISRVVFWFVFVIAISAALNQLNLNAISAPFANMINQVLMFIPTLLAAVAIAVVGWILATIARTAALTALNKVSLDDRLAKDVGVKPMSDTLADVVYWFILLITLTMVLGRLGLQGLFTPLINMIDKIFAFIPNVITAGFIFFIGYVVAKVIKGIATNVVASLNLQEIAKKAGVGEQNNLPNIAGSLAFLLVIVPFTIVALDTLRVEAISRPATNMLNEIMTALPNIITAVAVLVVTFYVVRMVANIIKGLLVNTAINTLPAKVGMQDALGECKVSDMIGCGIVFFAMLFATIAAADILGFAKISEIVTMFIAFGGQILLGAVILFVGFWLANVIAGVVERSEKGSLLLANIVRVLITGLVLAMGLKAMGIADSIVNLAFGLTLGAVAVAFALAFGLGGREAVARYLARLQDKMEAECDSSVTNALKQSVKKADSKTSSSTFDTDDLK